MAWWDVACRGPDARRSVSSFGNADEAARPRRRAFRYIVVDASPVFGSAETLAWHGMIDRYILVARKGHTTTDDLGRAAERLHREKVLGVTFVGADLKHCVA